MIIFNALKIKNTRELNLALANYKRQKGRNSSRKAKYINNLQNLTIISC